MTNPASAASVAVYICHNCIPAAARVDRQWSKAGVQVRVKEIPCSGKIDVQYLFHALAGGASGICVVACPQGECTLAQGNYRAQIRIGTLRRLLAEIGLEEQRVELVRCSATASPQDLKDLLDEAVDRLAALGTVPVPAG